MRAAQRKTEAARDRTERLENELAALREDTRTAQRKRTRSATERKDCRTRAWGCNDGSSVPTNSAPR